MNALLIAAAALPALLALALAARGPLRAPAMAAAPWAAAPALLLSLLAEPGPPLVLEWLMLGARVGLDVVGQVFLFFTALLWTAAGVHARGYTRDDPRRRTFFVFFLLTLSGNLGLILARDLATFYAAFAVMTFAAYPLVVHRADAEARRAGRVYVIMAILGETMLLAGFVLAGAGAPTLALGDVAASVAASPYRDLIVALLLAGFGVKAGALPLHVWLPLAHPVAPTPASAVLSGAMIKAGLLGWLRFLPLGETALPGWGAALIALGLASAFFGVAIGVTQDDPKTALAYSSISQMGIINVAVGVGLADPRVWPAALAACLVYALHHGLAKGALFLGVAVAEAADTPFARRCVLAGLAFAGLAVAGAPMTSGMVAKGYLKEVAPFSPVWWPGMLDLLLPLAAVGTTLLMARFLVLVAGRTGTHAAEGGVPVGEWVPWAALLAAVAGAAWWVAGVFDLGVTPPGLPYAAALWVATWPVLLGVTIAGVAWALSRRRQGGAWGVRIAAGDLVVPAERIIAAAWARAVAVGPIETADPVSRLASEWYGVYARPDRLSTLIRMERAGTRWLVATSLAAVLALALLALTVIR
jgi:formate hydrogenlyase subunit 3/multisubunit Na+/H+ antiporter MnhD subunit